MNVPVGVTHWQKPVERDARARDDHATPPGRPRTTWTARLGYIAAIWVTAMITVAFPRAPDFVCFAMIGGLVIYLTCLPHRRHIHLIALVLTGLALPVIRYGSITGAGTAMAITPLLLLGYLGLACIPILAVRGILGERIDRRVLYGTIGLPSFVVLAGPVHALIGMLTPTTLDSALLRMDIAVFGDLTFATGRWLFHHITFWLIARWCYLSLALAAAIVYALVVRGQGGSVRPAELLWTWGVAGVVGALIYPWVPAVGPRSVFHEWPWTLPALTAARDIPFANVPRNAMPSLHAMWTFLICYGARGVNRWVWLVLLPWAAFTLLATLGAGEHYAIDLLAALPLTAAVILSSRWVLKPTSTL